MLAARPAERFTEFVGRCTFLVVGNHKGADDLRALCAPELAYGLEDVDVTDTGVLCPDCRGILETMARDFGGIPSSGEVVA